jgi:serine/threonine-protein kinase RsbW
LLTLDSIVESVNAAEESIKRFAQDVGFKESDGYFIGLAVREILINAIQHGNHFDPAKKVGLRVFISGDELNVQITDQGEGFRIESIPDPRLAENRELPSGRGIAMARAMMDEFSVERNSPGGTLVRMTKRIPTNSSAA